MDVILLCAGYATRLKPLTDTCPKPLLALAGQPMINYLMTKLDAVKEVRRILVVSNAKFVHAFEDWREKFYPKSPVDILNDGSTSNENRLGAIRDIAFVIREKRVSSDCLVLAGDNFFNFDLAQFIHLAASHKPAVTIAAYDVKDLELAKRYGLVSLEPSGRVTALIEKPEHPTTTLASTGVYFFPAESLSLIDEYLKGHQNPDAPGHYIRWLVEHSQVFAFAFEGTWYDIGDFESYRRADEKVRELRL